jgi:hypothetical protein
MPVLQLTGCSPWILMFSAKLRHIDYQIRKPCGTKIHIPIQLDERGLKRNPEAAADAPEMPAGVSEYMGEDCRACERHYRHCKAETAIVDVAERFDDLHSTDFITTEVTIEGRTVRLESPAPRALASLMGLLMASSGCPRLIPFRAMALFHQPFATAEENVVRAAGFWLIRCWTQGTTTEESPFTALQQVWDSLEDVNRHVGEKLLARTTSDAASNGIAFLDVLAKMGTLGLDSALDMLRPVLTAQAHASLPANS